MRLKRRVVHSVRGTFGEEKDVMVHRFVSSIYPVKYRPVNLLGVVNELFLSVASYLNMTKTRGSYIAGYKVKMIAVELVSLCEVRRPHTKVTELVYRSGPLLESLEPACRSVLFDRLWNR